MAIAPIANGESGASVRNKINTVISEVSPIEAAAEGSVFQKGATVNEAISREDFGNQRELFLKSNIGAKNLANSIIAWDSFERETLGNADSGQTWTNLFGADFTISSNVLRNGSGVNSVTYLDLSATISFRGFTLKAGLAGRAGITNANAFFFGKDVNNYYLVSVFRNGITLRTVVAGVETDQNHNWTFEFSTLGVQGISQNIEVELYFRTPIFDQTILVIKNLDLLQTKQYELTANQSTFSTIADVSKIGFYSTGSGADFIDNFTITNK